MTHARDSTDFNRNWPRAILSKNAANRTRIGHRGTVGMAAYPVLCAKSYLNDDENEMRLLLGELSLGAGWRGRPHERSSANCGPDTGWRQPAS